jgi:hypothetical protein
MSIQPPSKTLSFQGTPLHYVTVFTPFILTMARNFFTSKKLRILFFVSTPDEKLEMADEFAAAHVDELEPPEDPDEDASPTVRDAHKRQWEDYNKTLEAQGAFRLWFIEQIPEATQQFVSNTCHVDFAALDSVSEMRTHLHQVYGTLSDDDLSDLHDQLAAPYVPGTSLSEHIDRLNQVIRWLNLANEGLSDFLRYRYFVDSLKPHPEYRQFVRNRKAHGMTEYAALTRELIAHDRDCRTQAAAASAAAAAAALAVATAAAAAVPAPPQAQPAGQWKYPNKYCPIHGTCFHSQQECRSIQAGAKIPKKRNTTVAAPIFVPQA